MFLPEWILAAVLIWPLVAAAFFTAAGRRLGRAAGWLGPLVPLVPLAGTIALGTGLGGGPRVLVLGEWVPQLGVNLAFLIDGLSVFYALVVSGVGLLVFFYAAHYFGFGEPRFARFYACLSFFMGAMLGAVLSDNLVLLFVFWEMTGLASYLLIGFDHEKQASRAGARMALVVTMGTGLCLLAGVLLAGLACGTFSLREITAGPLPVGGGAAAAALVLIVAGAFGKSAQIPFHFWLPNAMAAPTPVSAYLHSATMVKLGVFLVARFYPVFKDHELWFPLLGGTCFTTMLAGAWLAFRSTDLKAILAYSTVSQLGFLMGFYGLGSSIGLRFDFLHITNHVIYKACLFMMAGVVDHAAGIRDVRQLGGLRRRLPWLAAAAFAGCAAMAGMPGTLGFISKELMLADLRAGFGVHPAGGPMLVGFILAGSVLKVAFAARIFFHTFCGREPEGMEAAFHKPGPWVQAPPVLLALLTVVLGIFPGVVEKPLDVIRAASVHAPDGGYLSIWHGFTLELLLSAAVVAAGAGLFLWREKRGWRDVVPVWARWDAGFERAMTALPAVAGRVSGALRAGRPLDYLPLVLAFVLATTGAYLLSPAAADLRGALGAAAGAAPFAPLRVFTAFLLCASAILVVVLRGWMAQLLSLSAAGILTTFYFVLFRAPDLALTQILVESATLLGLLLLLSRFPVPSEAGATGRPVGRGRQAWNAALACGCGLLVAALAAIAMAVRHPEPIGPGYLEATLPLAKGGNAVNTILIDFRGFDTLGEITVLLVAVLGAVGLVMRFRRPAPAQAQRVGWEAGA